MIGGGLVAGAGPSASPAGQTLFTGTGPHIVGPSSASLELRGNLAAGDSGVDVVIGATNLRTAGKVLSIRESTTELFSISHAGAVDAVAGVIQYTIGADTDTGLNVPNPDHLTLVGGNVNLFAVSRNGGTSKIGFFSTAAVTPVVQQTSGANLTNNVTAGGTDDTIADYSSLTVYATDAAAIRNDIYQLARKVKQINDGLRTYGLFT